MVEPPSPRSPQDCSNCECGCTNERVALSPDVDRFIDSGRGSGGNRKKVRENAQKFGGFFIFFHPNRLPETGQSVEGSAEERHNNNNEMDH